MWRGSRRRVSLERETRAYEVDETNSTIVPDTSRGGGSQIANQDGREVDVESQRLPTLNASTPAPGRESGRLQPSGPTFIPIPVALEGRGQTHRGTVEARSEQPNHDIPDLYFTEREHKDRGPGIQQPSEAALERACGGGQDGGDADNLVQSRRSRGKSWCSADYA